MDFADAIKAHSDWKMKLNRYIAKPDGSLKPQIVSQDCLCDLGKWIHGEGKQKFNLENIFVDLKKRHAEFHIEAAKIVEKADKHEAVSQDVALGSQSKFAQLSNEVVTLIMKMKALAK